MIYKLPILESIKKMDLKDTNTITIFIIVFIILFTFMYIWLNNTNSIEGFFSQYNINSGDLVSLYGLDNVVVGNSNPLSLSSTLNNLIDARNATTLSNTYAKNSDVANIISNVSILQTTVNNLQTTLSNTLLDINNMVTSNITLMNNNLTSNVALMNNNLTSNITLMNNNLTSNIALIVNGLNNFKNIPKFIANINYTRTALTPNVNNVYNLGTTFLEIFNWNNPANVKNVSTPFPTLPKLQASTSYIFHVAVTGYAWDSISKLVCLDNNNSDTLAIANINNNNAFYSNMYHAHMGCNFMVTTNSNNPNIIIGYANALVQNQADTTSIIIYQLISTNFANNI